MSPMTDPVTTPTVSKRDVLALVAAMPNQFDPEELMYRLYVRRQIELGSAAVNAGDVVYEAEVDRQIEEWLASDGPDQR